MNEPEIDLEKPPDTILVWRDYRGRKTWERMGLKRKPRNVSMLPTTFVRAEMVDEEFEIYRIRTEELEMVIHKLKVELNGFYTDQGVPPAKRELVRMADNVLTGETAWKKKTARMKRQGKEQ